VPAGSSTAAGRPPRQAGWSVNPGAQKERPPEYGRQVWCPRNHNAWMSWRFRPVVTVSTPGVAYCSR